MKRTWEIIVVGAGPAGSTCALYAARLGLEVLLIDQKRFPRDKVCGDLIPRRGVTCLRELGLLERLYQVPHRCASGIVFSSPRGITATVPFALPGVERGGYVCYLCRRQVFDDLLFQAAREEVTTWEGCRVDDLILEDGQVRGVIGTGADGTAVELRAKVVVGADGYQSVVARRLGLYDRDPRHWAVATRAYYRGVKGMTEALEIHFIRALLPGYFWIFPLDDGLVNVGLGMRYRELKRRRLSLRTAHLEVLHSAFFRDRFADAELVGDIAGWNLPLGSKQRVVHGHGFVLVGDAAGLVNPFSGEGIGNAMHSGKIAAEVLAAACQRHDFSADSLQAYADRLWTELGSSLRVSASLQRLGQIRPLLDLVIGRAARNPEVRTWLAKIMAGQIPKKTLLSPRTYLRLLSF